LAHLALECTNTEEGDRMEVSKVKAIIDELYGVFCDGRGPENMADPVEYAVAGNEFPFPFTRLEEETAPVQSQTAGQGAPVGTLGANFTRADLTDPVTLKIREWMSEPKPGGLGAPDSEIRKTSLDATRDWVMTHFKGTFLNGSNFKPQYDAWLAS